MKRTLTILLLLGICSPASGFQGSYEGTPDRNPFSDKVSQIAISFDTLARTMDIEKWDIFLRNGLQLLEAEPFQGVMVPANPALPDLVFSFGPMTWRDFGGQEWVFEANTLNAIRGSEGAWVIDSSSAPVDDFGPIVDEGGNIYSQRINNLRTSAPEPTTAALILIAITTLATCRRFAA